ncbi:MAG: hypothetical protein KDA47_03130 [Planctomycetales bacterium]|nr:hypothetical protein [Planctomycetales bacterium]
MWSEFGTAGASEMFKTVQFDEQDAVRAEQSELKRSSTSCPVTQVNCSGAARAAR